MHFDQDQDLEDFDPRFEDYGEAQFLFDNEGDDFDEDADHAEFQNSVFGVNSMTLDDGDSPDPECIRRNYEGDSSDLDDLLDKLGF